MVSTRSQVKNMSITSEMRTYFENLRKPLVTNENQEELLKSFQDEIVKSFEHKLKDQNTKIEEFSALSDINCSLVLKFNGNMFLYFHSEYELSNLLNS